jgi:hypothetical protein
MQLLNHLGFSYRVKPSPHLRVYATALAEGHGFTHEWRQLLMGGAASGDQMASGPMPTTSNAPAFDAER